MKHSRWLVLPLGLMLLVTFSSVFAAAPTGAGPNDPLSATGAWLPVGANGQAWYYFDYTGDRSQVQVDLDTNGAPNVSLLILTPEQAQAFVQDPTVHPVGLGTPPGPNSQAASHDLVWVGSFNFPGRFFAVVLNGNPSPASVRMLISGSNVITGPTPTPTAPFSLPNPLATPIPTGSIAGRLVFQDASGGNIYTVRGDGSNLQRVTYGLDPSWSPDGRRIAFSRWNAPAGLYMINADGSGEQPVFGGNQLLSPQISPDGTRLVFTRPAGGSSDSQFCFRGFCFNVSGDPHWKLGVVDLANGTLSEPQCSNHCFSPTWNADSRTVAYADAQYGILATGTDPNSGPAWNLFTQNPDVQSPSYSPDGRSIVFMVRQHDHWEVNWMNADGSGVTPVTFADPLSFKSVNNVAPTWSPDGREILFLSDRNGKWEFFRVQRDGTGMSQVLKSVTDAMPMHYNFSNERVIDWIQ